MDERSIWYGRALKDAEYRSFGIPYSFNASVAMVPLRCGLPVMGIRNIPLSFTKYIKARKRAQSISAAHRTRKKIFYH